MTVLAVLTIGSCADDASPPSTTPIGGLASIRVPTDRAVFGGPGPQSVSGVAATDSGFVAVGYDEDDAAVWTSLDGLTWTRVPHDAEVFGGSGYQQMRSVAAGGIGVVA